MSRRVRQMRGARCYSPNNMACVAILVVALLLGGAQADVVQPRRGGRPSLLGTKIVRSSDYQELMWVECLGGSAREEFACGHPNSSHAAAPRMPLPRAARLHARMSATRVRRTCRRRGTGAWKRVVANVVAMSRNTADMGLQTAWVPADHIHGHMYAGAT